MAGGNPKPRVLCLSAYEAASHRQWRELLERSLPGYEWHSLTLPPRHFRWRIRGNPLSWLNEPLLEQSWDLVIATSMVDLATLRGIHPALARAPAIAYFHENQFAYPDRRKGQGSNEPGIVNLYTALSADRVLFNSDWNRRSLIEGVEKLMRQLPDHKPRDLTRRLEAKSEVVPVPIDDGVFFGRDRDWSPVPHLLWNHRWEYDKGPDRLLAILRALKRNGQAFRISVVGQQFRSAPEAFEAIRAEFNGELVHFGFLASEDDYRSLLGEADLVLSTALHDFQGLAILEGMAAGAVPVVPDRLAYPEYVPAALRYESSEVDVDREAAKATALIRELLNNPRPACATFRPDAYRASQVLPLYERAFSELLPG
ncbi:glycosyltransferase involved in cell wall biosynthesis [Halospina denitrificans]|uniref:tRNA-queuosine alpha-mannosyltransferase n=1 Tax=Halospina denitrificans TaxID=332522 RepID=A0A4R7JN95_9GAMM|nr:DUF3524 domain-containing protein [Halospina denitrificans]TDT39305.1 glycosyltransferase involved in cell wall biosynthesis [Halospina denitrificans]